MAQRLTLHDFEILLSQPTGGPWRAAGYGAAWYIVNVETGAYKKIGPVSRGRGVNYLDRAIDEAIRRNRKQAHQATYRLGKAAFKRGAARVPVHDKDLMTSLENGEIGETPNLVRLTAWLDGWDDMNLAQDTWRAA
jgi:hypothetical protein